MPLPLNLPSPEEVIEENYSSSPSSPIIEKEFKCDECGKKLNNEYYLKRHLKARHPDYFPKKLKRDILEPKSMRLMNKTFKCDKCYKTMANKSNLERHIRVVHPDIDIIKSKKHLKRKKKLQKRKCNTCHNTFLSKINLKHCRNCSKNISDPTKRKYLRCPTCRSSYSKSENKREQFNEHVRICKTEEQCEFCKRVFRRASLKSHKELCDPNSRKSKEDRTCQICGYVFLISRRLQEHYTKFKGTCLSNFNPSKHVRASVFDDGNPKGLKERDKKICNICAKAFNYTKSLQQHLETIHGENIVTKIHMVKEFLKYNKYHGVTKKLNEVYCAEANSLDNELYSVQSQSIERDEW